MCRISKEQKLLFTIYYISQYLNGYPHFDKFNEKELMVSFPKTSCNLYTFSDAFDSLIKDIENEYNILFAFYNEEQQYIETRPEIRSCLLGCKLDFALPDEECNIEDLMLRIFLEDQETRDNLYNTLSSTSYRQTRFAIEKNEYTASAFTPDIDGSLFIFIATDDETAENTTGIVDNLNEAQIKKLFDKYFQTGQDSIEFFYIFNDNRKSSNLFIALRKSLIEHDIKIKKVDNKIEFYSKEKKVFFNYDKNCYAEKLMLSLLFDNTITEGIENL